MEYVEVKLVEKPWGREIHFAVEREYVGKVLEVTKGHRLSHQYHTAKKETFYVLKGSVKLTLGSDVEVLEKGKSITVHPGVKHRIEALEDSMLLEVSTTELDDIIRLEDDYGRIDL